MPVTELQRETPGWKLSRLLLPASSRSLLFRATAAAFLIRMVVVALVYRSLPASSQHNGGFGWELGWVAGSIATGHGFSSPFWPQSGPTALVPPGYPYLLAAIFRSFGLYTVRAGLAILTLQSFFSALTCIPIFSIARAAVNTRTAGFAAWIWVVYPFSIYYSTVVWEWSLTALLFATSFALLLRLHDFHRTSTWIFFGLLYGLTALINPAVLSVFPLLLATAIWRRRRAGRRWGIKAALTTVALATVIAPWIAHVSRTMHTFVPVRDNFWLEFYAGNSGDSFESNVAWAHPASNPSELAAYLRMDESRYLEQKHRLAVTFVRHNPGWFVRATARRIIRYWTGFWSFSSGYLRKEPLDVPNVFFCSGVTLLMFRGLGRIWKQGSMAALPATVLILFFPVTYYFTHASMDYRQPLEPMIVILAMKGVLSREGPSVASSRLTKLTVRLNLSI